MDEYQSSDDDEEAEALLDDIEQHIGDLFSDDLGQLKSDPEEGECSSDSIEENIKEPYAQKQDSPVKVKIKTEKNRAKRFKQRLIKRALKRCSHYDYDQIAFNFKLGKYNWDKDLFNECGNIDKTNSDTSGKKDSLVMDLPVNKMFCNLCGEGFHNYTSLEKHILSFPKTDHAFVCRSCGKGDITLLVTLYNHALRCPNFLFFDSTERNYAKENPNFIQYHCDFCNKGFAVLQDFLLHKSNIHKKEFVSCPICSFKFSNWNALFCHMQSHSLIGNVDLKCKLCHLPFYIPWTYESHILTVHDQSDPQDILYQCCLCPAVFINDKSGFLSHVHRHGNYFSMKDIPWGKHNIKNGRPLLHLGSVQCPICAKIFSSREKLARHKRFKHSGHTKIDRISKVASLSQQIKINKPENIINQKVTNNQLKKRRAKESEVLIKCRICNLQISKSKFSEHKASHKTKAVRTNYGDSAMPEANTNKICPKCNIFVSLSDFNIHMQVHLDEVIIKCSECATTFDSVPNLIRHRRSNLCFGSTSTRFYEPPASLQLSNDLTSSSRSIQSSTELPSAFIHLPNQPIPRPFQNLTLPNTHAPNTIQFSQRQQDLTLRAAIPMQLSSQLLQVVQRPQVAANPPNLLNLFGSPALNQLNIASPPANVPQVQFAVNTLNQSDQPRLRFEPPASVRPLDE